MKLILPDGTKMELDKELPHEERMKIVDDILIAWNLYFSKYRNRKTLVCLEVLSNYLCYEKKEKQVGEHDGKKKK